MAPTPQFVLGVDARDLTNLYRDLLAADKEIAAGLLAMVKSSAQPVAADAASTASGFSQKIPGTIKLSTAAGSRARVKVKVTAGGKQAPNAAPLENMGNAGKFRHPVFGNRNNWVEQTARPFLIPALQRNLDKVAAAVDSAVSAFLEAHGL